MSFEQRLYPLEGDILRNQDGALFEVIGFDHPADGVVAYIKYIPSSIPTDRKLIENGKIGFFRRIIDLAERIEYTKNVYPHYMVEQSESDLVYSIIPNSEITDYFYPDRWFQAQIDTATQEDSDLISITRDFCNLLIQEADIPSSAIGVSGSQLIGLTDIYSDIDLIIYGQLNALKVRQIIRNYFKQANSTSEFRPYNLAELKALYHARKDNSGISFIEFLKYAVRKLDQGKFRGKDFFIRFFENDDRDIYCKNNTFAHQKLLNLGKIKISGEVRGDQHWWMTPAWVEIGNIQIEDKSELCPNYSELLTQYDLHLPSIWRTFTLRGRFIENIRLLEHFTGYGTLELIVPEKEPPYLQIAFGATATDYLKLK